MVYTWPDSLLDTSSTTNSPRKQGSLVFVAAVVASLISPDSKAFATDGFYNAGTEQFKNYNKPYKQKTLSKRSPHWNTTIKTPKTKVQKRSFSFVSRRLLNRSSIVGNTFLNVLKSYEKHDNTQLGNRDKYEKVALHLIQNLHIHGNMDKLRTLIERELINAYNTQANPEYHGFWGNVWNDATFFGSIRGKASNQIVSHNGAVYDNRIKGVINFDTPNELLAQVKNRVPSQETENIAFVIKDQKGVNIFVYYEAGKLKYAFPTSPGAERFELTPKNMVVTNRRQLANYYQDDLYQKTRQLWRDGKKGGAMPYSLRLNVVDSSWNMYYDGHNTHIGKVTGKNASHGCLRQWALWAYLIFYGVKPGTVIYYRPDIRLPKESK